MIMIRQYGIQRSAIGHFLYRAQIWLANDRSLQNYGCSLDASRCCNIVAMYSVLVTYSDDNIVCVCMMVSQLHPVLHVKK